VPRRCSPALRGFPAVVANFSVLPPVRRVQRVHKSCGPGQCQTQSVFAGQGGAAGGRTRNLRIKSVHVPRPGRSACTDAPRGRPECTVCTEGSGWCFPDAFHGDGVRSSLSVTECNRCSGSARPASCLSWRASARRSWAMRHRRVRRAVPVKASFLGGVGAVGLAR